MYGKAYLSKMKRGEILEIIADGMCAVEGLPDAVTQAGHKLLSIETLDNGLNRYSIEVI